MAKPPLPARIELILSVLKGGKIPAHCEGTLQELIFLPHSNSSANKSLARYLLGFVEIYREISKGFLEKGISKFESYVVSQPGQAPEIFSTKSLESPPLAGLLPAAA
jgi:hypothetical protein